MAKVVAAVWETAATAYGRGKSRKQQKWWQGQLVAAALETAVTVTVIVTTAVEEPM